MDYERRDLAPSLTPSSHSGHTGAEEGNLENLTLTPQLAAFRAGGRKAVDLLVFRLLVRELWVALLLLLLPPFLLLLPLQWGALVNG